MSPRKAPEQIPVTLKVSPEEVAGYESAAAAAGGMSRQAWCKAVLNAAAEISMLPDQLKAAKRAAKRAAKK